MALDENKRDMINKIIGIMETEGKLVQENPNYSTDNQLSRVDVILDVVHFLKDYEENVKILTEYALEHRFDKKAQEDKSLQDAEKGER